jgi:hypothetical protein
LIWCAKEGKEKVVWLMITSLRRHLSEKPENIRHLAMQIAWGRILQKQGKELTGKMLCSIRMP